MGIRKEQTGTMREGKPVTKYTLENQNGIQASFYDLGAVMTNLWVPDREGKREDIVLGYDDVTGYLINVPSFGAPIGRYANRISDGRFTLNGREYKLDRNDGTNCLHGGYLRYNHLFYTVECEQEEGAQKLIFSRRSPDGEQGFPGNLDYSISYTLTDRNELIIQYDAVSDQDTIINMTNHSYFNLGRGGHRCGDVLGHQVRIYAKQYTPTDEEHLPTGEILPVEGTPFDFTQYRKLGDVIVSDPASPDYFPGYDHNYILGAGPEQDIRLAAQLRCPDTGRQMEVLTDRPGIQFYTAPTLEEPDGKEQTEYGSSAAVCFESQSYPNAINMPSFPSPVLRAGEEYSTTTIFRFSVFHEAE